MTNAFKIMKHPDSFLFRCEQLEEKRSFLMLVKRATDDLLASRKKDKPNTNQATRNTSEDQNRMSSGKYFLHHLSRKHNFLFAFLLSKRDTKAGKRGIINMESPFLNYIPK